MELKPDYSKYPESFNDRTNHFFERYCILLGDKHFDHKKEILNGFYKFLKEMQADATSGNWEEAEFKFATLMFEFTGLVCEDMSEIAVADTSARLKKSKNLKKPKNNGESKYQYFKKYYLKERNKGVPNIDASRISGAKVGISREREKTYRNRVIEQMKNKEK